MVKVRKPHYFLGKTTQLQRREGRVFTLLNIATLLTREKNVLQKRLTTINGYFLVQT